MSENAMSNSDENSYLTDEYLGRLKELTEAIESRDEDKIESIIGELTSLRESALYRELGMLTREIHDAIRDIGKDERLVELAKEEIPDAKQRLNFILTKTDESAHLTLSEVEQGMDVIGNLKRQAGDIQDRWKQFRARKLSKQEFIQLNADLEVFLESMKPQSELVNANMTAIMMAQEYQDITGQMIKQVITMVQEIEEKLVRLVSISGDLMNKHPDSEKVSACTPVGPQLPNADQNEVATSQGDVDDLLASLGF